MKHSTPSLTANKVGMMRAAHQLFDNPIVFEDQIALSILGAESISDIRSKKQKFTTRLHSYLRAIVVARSSFAESELYEAMKRGVSQYVILGAGLDTFAYRNPTCSDSLHVFEIDNPATQQWKRHQLNQANIQIPERSAILGEGLKFPEKMSIHQNSVRCQLRIRIFQPRSQAFMYQVCGKCQENRIEANRDPLT